MVPPHVQSAWGSRGERVWATALATGCNYFSKKKKNTYNTRGNTNKSPTKLICSGKQSWHDDWIHYYHNWTLTPIHNWTYSEPLHNWIHYLILTYSWTLTPIHNWTYSVVVISSSQCTAPNMWLTNRCTDPSTWLTTNLRRMLAAKFFSSSTRWRSRNSLVTKPYGVQMQQLLQKKDELGQLCLRSQYACNNKCNNQFTALKTLLIYI